MMRKLLTFAALAIALAACSGGGNSPPPPPPSVNGWALYYSPGGVISAAPGALFSITFPANSSACPSPAGTTALGCLHIDYVTMASPALNAGQTITLTGSIAASADAVFNHFTATDNTAAGHPSACRIFFSERGDNLSGQGAYAYYRWWANDPADVVLQNGTFSVSAVLSPGAGGGWTSVEGEQATNSAAATAGFAQAMANPDQIGFTCGGGYYYGHGVNMSSGTGTMTVTAYTVQ